MNGRPFHLWVFGDAHVGTDLRRGRESLADALRDSEDEGEGGFGVRWDLALDVGDMSGEQGVPQDAEGREVVRQFGALRRHRREDVYSLCGNHDRGGLREPPAAWWRKWVDPLGENTHFSGVDPTRRRFPGEGTWERYSFRAGNLLFLVMSDINEPSQSVGRGDLGGNPAGVVSRETYQWWVRQVEAHPDCIIVSAHHYVLKDTTVASGAWEGLTKGPDGEWKSNYHGYKPQGAPAGASYLYFVGGVSDAQAFEGYFRAHPAAIDLWIGGHTHTHPDDRFGDKGPFERKWGVHFLNAAGLTAYHGHRSLPSSRLITFTDGGREARVRTYLHTATHGPQGWYPPAEKAFPLRGAFRHPGVSLG